MIDELAPRAESFAVRFVSDREMRRLNSAFRRRDEPTDVLSFSGDFDSASRPAPADGDVADLESGLHLGDVVISVPTSRRQADHLGHSVETELRILLLHGVLHCLGHDHETDGGDMNRLERRLRRRYLAHE
ncbi:MAG: rRNA maturation RNase YbeY [bacterium]|nr:rRNA maturation RNase YbeY [bacterium]